MSSLYPPSLPLFHNFLFFTPLLEDSTFSILPPSSHLPPYFSLSSRLFNPCLLYSSTFPLTLLPLSLPFHLSLPSHLSPYPPISLHALPPFYYPTFLPTLPYLFLLFHLPFCTSTSSFSTIFCFYLLILLLLIMCYYCRYMTRPVMSGPGLYDPTTVMNADNLTKCMREGWAKLAFYLISFFYYLYRYLSLFIINPLYLYKQKQLFLFLGSVLTYLVSR